MKYILLVGLLAVGVVVPAVGQTWTNPLPIDSASHKVTYTDVVQVPGASKAELYTRARAWFATSFASAKAVLEMDDVQAGQLIGNATGYYYARFMGADAKTTLWRTINVQIKDGRYKYTITNFAVDIQKGRVNATPIESFFVQSRYTYDKEGVPKPYLASIIKGVQDNGESQVQSLRAAMATPAEKGKEKDW